MPRNKSEAQEFLNETNELIGIASDLDSKLDELMTKVHKLLTGNSIVEEARDFYNKYEDRSDFYDEFNSDEFTEDEIDEQIDASDELGDILYNIESELSLIEDAVDALEAF